MIDRITAMQAFKAKVCFLEDYYYKTSSDDLGSLLGDMQLFEDGSTWDPTIWNDWIIALENRELVTAIEGFACMYNFLHAYYERTSSASMDIKIILDAMELEICERSHTFVIWNLWMECIKKN